jgi:hypothetical protein
MGSVGQGRWINEAGRVSAMRMERTYLSFSVSLFAKRRGKSKTLQM